MVPLSHSPVLAKSVRVSTTHAIPEHRQRASSAERSRATPQGRLRASSAERPRAPLTPPVHGSPRSPDWAALATPKDPMPAMVDTIAYGKLASRDPSLRKAEGQLRLDAHAAAQMVHQQLVRAEHMLPVAQAAEAECTAAYEVAQGALDANPLLHGGVVPDTKAVSGRSVPTRRWLVTESNRVVTTRRPRSIQDGLREELRHALRHLAQSAGEGQYSMGRRVAALVACIEALRESCIQLTDTAPIQSPRSRTPRGRRHREHGHLSPGTMAPDHIASLETAESSGARRVSDGSPLADAGSESDPHVGEEAAGGNLTRSVWMFDSTTHEDIRGSTMELLMTANQVARAAQNLIAFTREQVRHVRAGLVHYRDKVQEAQRKIVATSARARYHLGSPRRGPRSPPSSQRRRDEPFSKSPIDVGQDVNTGTQRWPPAGGGRKHRAVNV